jgi:SAM-dependent methyltransferase
MSHFEQKKFVEFSLDELKKKNNFNNLSILDVGSYDVGGSIRDFFKKNNYIGVDLIKGPNVDIVLSGTELYKLKKNFDIVISCECFEHAKDWREIFLSMYNVCEDDGYVIFTCASRGRIEHGTLRTINSDSPGTTGTYYKNIFKSEFIKSFDLKKMFQKYEVIYNFKSSDLYFIGKKGKEDKNINFTNILKKVKNLKNNNRKIKIFRIIFSYLLNDKNYQNLTFFRRSIKKIIFGQNRHIFK